ncbi:MULTISPECIES: hypothetical protein [unclassified Lentilitoribacter]|jgi:hypothetical protein|uniref:hypothetical protein n=1 Tax=unclassified Lentilitoribacter TaxID=2647570 RepID=UPI0013A6FA40|nr:hypothetical protein [Lentilitoribacter sp. Alg239-R112]
MRKERRSFVEILGATAPKRQPPLFRSNARGFGTTDTLPQATRPFAQAEDAHMNATVYRQSKPISHSSDFYLLEDTKSRAGSSYKQTDYVVVTREKSSDTSHIGMVARRLR